MHCLGKQVGEAHLLFHSLRTSLLACSRLRVPAAMGDLGCCADMATSGLYGVFILSPVVARGVWRRRGLLLRRPRSMALLPTKTLRDLVPMGGLGGAIMATLGLRGVLLLLLLLFCVLLRQRLRERGRLVGLGVLATIGDGVACCAIMVTMDIWKVPAASVIVWLIAHDHREGHVGVFLGRHSGAGVFHGRVLNRWRRAYD